MKKKHILKVLALTLGILSLPVISNNNRIANNLFIEEAHAATLVTEYRDSQDIVYLLYNDGTAKIKGGTYSEGKYTHSFVPNVNDIVIPATIDYQGNTYKLDQILSGAFSGISNITSVQLPSTPGLIIDSYAFQDTSITSLTIPVPMYIRWSAFRNMGSLETATFAEGQEVIPLYLFSGCKKLATVNLPSTINTIEDHAFQFTNLSSLDISYVDRLSALSIEGIPNSCNVIANGTTFIENGILYNKKKKRLIKVMDKYQITSTLNLDNAVEEIGDFAFRGVRGITTVNTGANLKSIGDFAFDESSIVNINFPSNSKLNSIGVNAFSNCTSLKEIILPEAVTSIGDYCFYNDSELTKVTMHDNVTSLGPSSFKNCEKLETLKLSNNLDYIDGGTFENCNSLTELSLPTDLTIICYGANNNTFKCRNLKWIKAPIRVVQSKSLVCDTSLDASYNNRVYFYDEDNLTALGAYWVKNNSDMSDVQEAPKKTGKRFVRWVPKVQSESTLDKIVSDITFIAEYEVDNPVNTKLEAPTINMSKLNPSNRENVTVNIN